MRSVPTHRPSRQRRIAVVLTAVPLGLALTGPARADPPWSTPRTVGPGGFELQRLVVGTHGASLTYGYGRTPVLVPVAADGAPGRTRNAAQVRDVGGYGDRVVYLRSPTRAGTPGVSFGDLGARSLGALHRVARAGEDAEDLTVGPGGHVLVPLSSGVSDEEESYLVAAARYRFTWSAPGRRSRWSSVALPGRAGLLAAAIDRRGDAVLLLQRATTRGYLVTARTLRLRTGRLGPERTLDRTTRDSIDGSVAVDDHGGAVLAWGMQDGGEEADHPYVVRAAFRRRGTTAFTRATTLDPGGTRERPGGRPYAAMDASGRATVAWTQAIGELDGPTSPRLAVATRAARFGPRTELLPEGYVSGLAVHDGTTVVAVTGSAVPFAPTTNSLDAPPPTVAGVAVRRGAGSFGPIEPVATPTPRDRGGLLVGGSSVGFRAVWNGARSADRDALRWASRLPD